MKANSTLTRISRNKSDEKPFEAEIGKQTLIEIPSAIPREEPSLERRKEEASQPLYLFRYE